MAVETHSEEARIIRQLVPMANLPHSQFIDICRLLQVETAEKGDYLFKRGDEDVRLYYLLDGVVALQTEAFTVETIKAGSDSARFAIAHQIPRKIDAIALSSVQFIRLNADMMTPDHEAPYQEVETTMMLDEPADEDDWMTTLLRSPIFRVLPPANLQRILISLEEVSFEPGALIIQQGDQGDYYYIIKTGRVLISRKPSPNAKEIKLAQLGDLDSFGEDSLISGEPRNVSVTAMTDTVLLRLNKQDFNNLIKKPTLKYVKADELDEWMKKGAELIDVRGVDEYKAQHLPNSVNVPFFSLRMHMKSLDRHRPVIVVCQDGRTSESAAFILQRFKFNALVLKGGVAAVKPAIVPSSGPASFTIDDGAETSNLVEVEREPEAELESDVGLEESGDLEQLVQQLRAKCADLEADKATLEVKCASLSRQLDQLKMELIKLRRGG